ncbi:probable ubiquitin carboxyl-terminal hydrolase MINDY-4 [Porites lutea]|uniref:probable ubiquitin carboxyl-terminal hydrolase MINDY-4 n=1 Tax=Porites lutea TaxID=51062 RepID=UPI003CC5B8DA
MGDSQIVSITASLVREYLSRKGLKTTLQTLDKEMPRTEDSISNRLQLAKEMHIERLMKKNKELPEPFRTMLEVMVQFMKNRDVQSGSTSVGADKSSQKSKQTRERKKESSTKSTAQPSNNDLIDNMDKLDEKKDRKDYDDLLKRLEKPSSKVHGSPTGIKFANDSTKVQVSTQKDDLHKGGGLEASDIGGLLQSGSLGPTVSLSDQMALKQKSKRRLNSGIGGPVISSGLAVKRDSRTRHSTGRLSGSLTAKSIGSLFGDDEDSKELSSVSTPDQDPLVNKTGELHNTQDVPVDRKGREKHRSEDISAKHHRRNTSNEISRNQPVTSTLRNQKAKSSDLVFEDIDDDLDQELGHLTLGPKKITQVDIQNKPITLETAMGLKNLIFGNAKSSFTPEWRNQSFSFCDLYRLEYGIVQLKGGPCGVLAAVQAFVLKHLLFGGKKGDSKKKLQPSSRERTKALTSAISEILWRAGDSRGAVVALPTGGSNVFGAGRYKPDQLTEALVLYTFKSSESLLSFISQNISQFESDSSSGCILLLYSVILSRSIRKVISDMDEPQGRLMGVGVNYKTPNYPIWVICSESHFSVLFSIDRNLLHDWRLEKKFDLYYYDGLARQDEELRLTVDTTKECPEYKDTDLVPPLEHCIRTRWKSAVIDWNGSEPIL